MYVHSKGSVMPYLPRWRKLFVGFLLILVPVILLFPVKEILVYAPSKHWTDTIEGVAYVSGIIFELLGLGLALRSATRRMDLITLCALLVSLMAALIVVWNIEGLAYLIKYL
jgi:hypothetical protein